MRNLIKSVNYNQMRCRKEKGEEERMNESGAVENQRKAIYQQFY